MLFRGVASPLQEKIEQLLHVLLPFAGYQVMPVTEEADIDSESDYDDDFIQDYQEKLLNSKICGKIHGDINPRN